MEHIRGAGRGSWIKGRSVHNQPIERLWGIYHSHTTKWIRGFFEHLERDLLLWQKDDCVDEWCLTAVFQPLIQNKIDEFVRTHNSYPTRRRGIPEKLFISQLIAHPSMDDDAHFAATTTTENERSDVHSTSVHTEEGGVQIHAPLCPVSAACWAAVVQECHSNVHRLHTQTEFEHGLQCYIFCRACLQELMFPIEDNWS